MCDMRGKVWRTDWAQVGRNVLGEAHCVVEECVLLAAVEDTISAGGNSFPFPSPTNTSLTGTPVYSVDGPVRRAAAAASTSPAFLLQGTSRSSQ